MADTRLRLAVFIDFDNIEIGVKNTLSTQFDAGLVLEALKERGEVVSKTAYSDWQRAGDYSRLLTQHAIKMVQRNLTPGGDKNGADINLALDALEMAFTHPHINAFVIVGGDSDFISLVEKLKQYDKKVFVVGGRQFTSNIMQKNCHEFVAYENLLSTSRRQQGSGRQVKQGDRQSFDRQPIEQAVPLVKRALKVLSEREVSPQLGLLKSTLLQLDSTFSERSYGAGTFRDFAEKLQTLGLVELKQEGRDLLVELKEGFELAEAPAPNGHDKAARPAHAPAASSASAAPAAEKPAAADATLDTSKQPDGIAEVRRVLTAAKASARWPMYIRQIKQVLKSNSPGFDERTFGFATLIDLLRAAQKVGLVRMERDRQGAVRLFQGQALQSAGDETMPPQSAPREGDTAVEEAMASEPMDLEPAVPVNIVDTTAAALGLSQPGSRGRRRIAEPEAPKPVRSPRSRQAGEKVERRAKPRGEKATKAAKAEKAAKPAVERRRSPRKPKATAADSSN